MLGNRLRTSSVLPIQVNTKHRISTVARLATRTMPYSAKKMKNAKDAVISKMEPTMKTLTFNSQLCGWVLKTVAFMFTIPKIIFA